jgi:predicted ArsR family transcriptional regulator
MSSESTSDKPWRFVTNHTQVLLCIARQSDVRLRDVAQTVGITERAAQRIVADLVEAGYVRRDRIGRRNRYVVDHDRAMRHPAQQDHQIGELLSLLRLDADGAQAPSPGGGPPGKLVA